MPIEGAIHLQSHSIPLTNVMSLLSRADSVQSVEYRARAVQYLLTTQTSLAALAFEVERPFVTLCRNAKKMCDLSPM